MRKRYGGQKRGAQDGEETSRQRYGQGRPNEWRKVERWAQRYLRTDKGML